MFFPGRVCALTGISTKGSHVHGRNVDNDPPGENEPRTGKPVWGNGGSRSASSVNSESEFVWGCCYRAMENLTELNVYLVGFPKPEFRSMKGIGEGLFGEPNMYIHTLLPRKADGTIHPVPHTATIHQQKVCHVWLSVL